MAIGQGVNEFRMQIMRCKQCQIKIFGLSLLCDGIGIDEGAGWNPYVLL